MLIGQSEEHNRVRLGNSNTREASNRLAQAKRDLCGKRTVKAMLSCLSDNISSMTLTNAQMWLKKVYNYRASYSESTGRPHPQEIAIKDVEYAIADHINEIENKS